MVVQGFHQGDKELVFLKGNWSNLGSLNEKVWKIQWVGLSRIDVDNKKMKWLTELMFVLDELKRLLYSSLMFIFSISNLFVLSFMLGDVNLIIFKIIMLVILKYVVLYEKFNVFKNVMSKWEIMNLKEL